MLSFSTAGSWEKDAIFGASQTNFRPCLFSQQRKDICKAMQCTVALVFDQCMRLKPFQSFYLNISTLNCFKLETPKQNVHYSASRLCSEVRHYTRMDTRQQCSAQWLDTIQDVLCKHGMKPHMHLVEISIFSLNGVIVRPTKIIKDLCDSSI